METTFEQIFCEELSHIGITRILDILANKNQNNVYQHVLQISSNTLLQL